MFQCRRLKAESHQNIEHHVFSDGEDPEFPNNLNIRGGARKNMITIYVIAGIA